MADYFAEFGLGTGNNDGSSWEDGYRSPADMLSGTFSASDRIFIKEHAGYVLTTSFVFDSDFDDVSVYGGFSSALTGTSGSPGTDDTGITVIDGNGSTSLVCLNVTADDFLLSKFRVTDFQATRGSFQSNASVSITLAGIVFYQNNTTANFRCFDYYGATVVCNDCVWDGNGRTANTFAGGGVFTQSGGGSITLNNCTIRNQLGATAVAISIANSTSCDLNDCAIYDNAANNGNIIQIGASGTVVNTLVADNTATTEIIESGVRFVGCTVVGNTNTGANLCHDGYGIVSNSIFWGNTGTGSPHVQIDNATTDHTVVEDKDTGGLGGTEGTGCVDVDPQFVGSGDPEEYYKLSASTPTSVSQGADTSATGYSSTDYFGVDRDATDPSMGFYEYVAGGVTVTVDTGVISISGAAVAIVLPVTISVDTGVIDLTGAGLDIDQTIVMDTGVIDLTGAGLDINVSDQDVVTIDAGSLSFSGLALNTDLGIYISSGDTALSGNAVSIVEGLPVELDQGDTSFDGQAIGISFSSSLEAGEVSFLGGDLSLTFDIVVAADTGVIALSGDSVEVFAGTMLSVDTGLSSFVGQSVDVSIDHIVSTSAGVLDFGGSDITIDTGDNVINIDGIAITPVLGMVGAQLLALNDFQNLLYNVDLSYVFMNNNEFAIDVVYAHSSLLTSQTYQVIFDDPHASVGVGEGEFNTIRPQFQISEHALRHRILKQDTCVIRGTKYYVEDFMSDGVGVTTVYLRLK